MSGGILEKNTVNQNYPKLMQEPDFLEMYRVRHYNLTREIPVPIDVDKHELLFCNEYCSLN